MRSAWLIAAAALLGACSESAAVTTSLVSTTAAPATTSAPKDTTTLPLATTTVAARDMYVRTCGSRIGAGYGSPDHEIPIYYIGPVALLDLDPQETSALTEADFAADSDGRYGAIKYVTVIDSTAVGPVDVMIGEEHRTSAGLVFDASRWDIGTLAAADHTVRFDVCPGMDAQFNGGFIITEPTCVHVFVIEHGYPAPRVYGASIPFGVPAEPCLAWPDLDPPTASFGLLDCSPGVVVREDVADAEADPEELARDASAEVVTVVHEPPSFWWGYDQNGRVIAAVALEDVTPLAYEVFTCEESVP